MHRNPGQIGAGANGLYNFFDIEMHIVESAYPTHKPISIAQTFALDQLLWVYTQCLHRSYYSFGANMRQATLCMSHHHDLAHTEQVDSAGERTDEVVAAPLALRCRNCCTGGT